MPLPWRKLGDRLRSCLKLVLRAVVELCAWRPLRANAAMQNASESAPEALSRQDHGIAHSWQPANSAANAENSHAPPQHREAVHEARDSLLALCRNGPNARISSPSRRFRTRSDSRLSRPSHCETLVSLFNRAGVS